MGSIAVDDQRDAPPLPEKPASPLAMNNHLHTLIHHQQQTSIQRTIVVVD